MEVVLNARALDTFAAPSQDLGVLYLLRKTAYAALQGCRRVWVVCRHCHRGWCYLRLAVFTLSKKLSVTRAADNG